MTDYIGWGFQDPINAFKQRILQTAEKTLENIAGKGFKVDRESLGEAATLIAFRDFYLALTNDGVGTKPLVADIMYNLAGHKGKWYYPIGIDLLAANANDLDCVGAQPVAFMDEVAVGSETFLRDMTRMEHFLEGLERGCKLAGMALPCGETPKLEGIIGKNKALITGSAIGIITPKQRAVRGKKLLQGDAIIVLSSNGIHANGLTLARNIAEKLPKKYLTEIDGAAVGEMLLQPTFIYHPVIDKLLRNNLPVHYMSNITGGGWRKIMRARQDLTYVIEYSPPVPQIFSYLQEHGKVSDEEAYSTWNMGVGFVIFGPEEIYKKVRKYAVANRMHAWLLGRVEKGNRRVVIAEKGIVLKPRQ